MIYLSTLHCKLASVSFFACAFHSPSTPCATRGIKHSDGFANPNNNGGTTGDTTDGRLRLVARRGCTTGGHGHTYRRCQR